LKESADLHVAFDEIKRRDGRVSEATASDPSYSASSIKHRRVHLDLPLCAVGVVALPHAFLGEGAEADLLVWRGARAEVG